MCLLVGIFSFYPGQISWKWAFYSQTCWKGELLDNGESTLAFPVFRTVKPSFNQQPARKLSTRKVDVQEARERRRRPSRLASLSQIGEFARRLLTYDYSSFLLSSSVAERFSSLENFHQQEEGPKNRGKQNKKVLIDF